MPPRTSWSNLLPGLIALAVVVSIAIGVVVFGGVGKERGDTVRLYVLTNAAQGVMGGTEVWLVGQKIGTVDRIDFRSPEADTSMRVVLALTVRREDASQIRHDSHAQIRMGGSVIGPAVVYLTAGTPSSPAIASGDTLRAQRQADAVGSGAKLMASASQELGPLMADARTVMALARRRTQAAQGSFIEEHNGEVAELRSNFTRLRDLLSGAGGSRSVMVGARSALARADSIRSLLNSPKTSLGRFRRDSTLGETVARVRDELARVRAQLASVEGSAGRFTRDSAMTRSIAEAQRELTLLMDDFRRRPRRYLAF
jgi:ABC-type transporter Mla subunit MlaD